MHFLPVKFLKDFSSCGLFSTKQFKITKFVGAMRKRRPVNKMVGLYGKGFKGLGRK